MAQPPLDERWREGAGGMGDGQLQILLIEDDEIDRELIERCLQHSPRAFQVRATPTAEAALHILCGEAGQPPLAKPYVIVLDLSLPGLDGFEFLQRVRHDPALKASPILIVTDSANPHDQVRANAYQVAGYLQKAHLGEQCRPLLAWLEAYPLGRASLAGWGSPRATPAVQCCVDTRLTTE